MTTPAPPRFDEHGHTISGTMPAACGTAIEAFRNAEYARLKLARAEDGLIRALAQMPPADMDAYFEATERIRATAAEQIDQIEQRAADRQRRLEYQTGRSRSTS